MIDIKKIITLDIEGDSLKKEINQKLFPTGCHFDPGTRIWCATFTTRIDGQIRTSTYTTKLNGTRAIYDNSGMVGMTTAEHYESTVIPTEIDTVFGHHKIKSFKDERDLFMDIIRHLMMLGGKYEIWIKGYNGYKYDYIAIMNSMKRLWPVTDMNKVMNFMNNVISIKFRDAAAEFPKLQVNWPGTTEQVQIGDFKDNQTYMNTGIIHNIEDSYQLFTMVERYAKEANAEERMKGDF